MTSFTVAAVAVVEVVVAGEAAGVASAAVEVAAGTDQVVVPARAVAFREGGGQSAALHHMDVPPHGHQDRALVALRHRTDHPLPAHDRGLALAQGLVLGEGTLVSEIVLLFSRELVQGSALEAERLEIGLRPFPATDPGRGLAPDKELARVRESPIGRAVDRALPIVPVRDKALAIGQGFPSSRRDGCQD